MSFQSSWLLVLLLLVPWWLVRRRRQLAREAVDFPPLQLRPVAARAGGGWRWLLALEASILTLAVLALAGPRRVQEVALFEEDGIDLALVLDISASMQAADFPPNRLEVCKQLSADLVRRGGGHRIGVYAFAGYCFTQTPFTTDATALVDLIGGLAYESIDHDPKSGGTAIGDALLVAISDLAAIRVAGRGQVVVLVTDGENNAGSDPLLAARQLRHQGIRSYVIGIGQDHEVPVFVAGKPFITTAGKQLSTRLDDRQLREIARLAGGTYFRADNPDLLGRIFAEIARLEHRPFQARGVRLERSQAPAVALALLLLLAAWLALDGLRLRRPMR